MEKGFKISVLNILSVNQCMQISSICTSSVYALENVFCTELVVKNFDGMMEAFFLFLL